LRHLGTICCGALALVLACAAPASAIPSDDLLNSLKPTADVNDFAHLLTAAELESLEVRCRQLRERTGAQLAIVTLSSLEGGELEDFTNKLFARWHIGEKDRDNGILLLVAMRERQSRIEVGYGLEPIIPDVLAGRILDHQLRPEFRQQDYAAGLNAAVDRISELVEKGEPADRAALARDDGTPLGTKIVLVLFLALFVAVGGFLIGSALGLKQPAGILPGGFFAGIPMLMGLAVVGLPALVVHLPVALLTAIVGWNAAKKSPPRGGRRTSSPSRPAAWDWDFPSSTGGWSSGGGGFSQGWGGFGGGSSGGGGASSSW
jgi:uncharacterized protein